MKYPVLVRAKLFSPAHYIVVSDSFFFYIKINPFTEYKPEHPNYLHTNKTGKTFAAMLPLCPNSHYSNINGQLLHAHFKL